MQIIRILLCAACVAFSLSACAPFFASHPNSVVTREVETPSGRLKIAVSDKGSGRPILLLHGLGTSGYTWRKLVPALSQTYRVISIDLRGFGASEKPLDRNYSVYDQAGMVEAFIEQEDFRDLTVVGHSFGGGVTLAMAVNEAQKKSRRIRNIILIDSIAYRQPLPLFFQLLRTTPLVAEAGMTLVPPEIQAATALDIAYHDRKRVPARTVMEYASPLYSPAARHALLTTVSQIVPPDIDKLAEGYKSVSVPTLLIWCDHDRIVPVKLGERLAREMPNARLRIIPACGHLPQEEQPEETLNHMLAFLRQH